MIWKEVRIIELLQYCQGRAHDRHERHYDTYSDVVYFEDGTAVKVTTPGVMVIENGYGACDYEQDAPTYWIGTPSENL